MFYKEPALHQAVIDGDRAAVIALSRYPELLLEKNSLGFTALELAFLLNNTECIRILHPECNRIIKIVFKDQEILKKCSPDEFEKAFNVKYLSHLHFSSYRELIKAIRNCPFLLRTKVGEENRALALAYQRELFEGSVVDVTVRWIDPNFGYGLFSNQELAPGVFIGEYTGLVRRLSRWKPDHNAYCFHYPTRFWSWNYRVVDALHEGNEMRFINHSQHPNLIPKCLVDRGVLHLAFFTSRQIARGEQLTFNYGPDFWRHRKQF